MPFSKCAHQKRENEERPTLCKILGDAGQEKSEDDHYLRDQINDQKSGSHDEEYLNSRR